MDGGKTMRQDVMNLKKMSKNQLIDFSKPKYVYIPLASGKDENVTVLVKKGDYVKIGTVIGKRKGTKKIPIHATVSGYVMGIEKKLYVTGQLVRCIKIENDGKECYLEENIDQKKMSQYTKEEFLETILDTGIVGLGGDAFPTYIKYNTDKKINTLVINAVECEPYNTSDTTLLFEKCEEILEAIDAIMEINHIEHAIIAVPKEETELIRKLNNFIGTYLNIEVKALSSSYPIRWERKLVKETKHVNYKFIPLEKGIIVNNVSTIYAIYEALKQKKPLVDRIVTFTGNGLKKQCNVKLKIGTLAKDVIKKIGGYQNVDDMILIAGGAMMGNALSSDELAISPEVSCVLVLPYEKNKIANPCIRCGKCVQMCPAKLNPVMIAEAYQEKNIKLLQQLEVKRCIGCGLCSFICPSNRNIRNQIKLAKKLCEEEGK